MADMPRVLLDHVQVYHGIRYAVSCRALGEHHDAGLAYGALVMAVAVRGGQVCGFIMHTDRGGEFTAGLFRAACQRLGIPSRWAGPGRRWMRP